MLFMMREELKRAAKSSIESLTAGVFVGIWAAACVLVGLTKVEALLVVIAIRLVLISWTEKEGAA